MLVYCVEAAVAHEVMTKKPKRKVGRPSGYKPLAVALFSGIFWLHGIIGPSPLWAVRT